MRPDLFPPYPDEKPIHRRVRPRGNGVGLPTLLVIAVTVSIVVLSVVGAFVLF